MRLKRRADFLRVGRAGRRWATTGFVLEARRREGDAKGAPPRVGFTVSRKVGTAVVRNRVRRRLRAAAERIIPTHAKAGYDFVLIARAASAARPFAALLGDLETALERVGAACPPHGAEALTMSSDAS